MGTAKKSDGIIDKPTRPEKENGVQVPDERARSLARRTRAKMMWLDRKIKPRPN